MSNGRALKLLLLAAVVTCIGYLPFLIDSLYRGIFQDKIRSVPFRLIHVACDESETNCSKHYEIDLRKAKLEGRSLVVGSVLTKSEWSCAGRNVFSTGEVGSILGNRTTQNEYFIVDAAGLSACEGVILQVIVSHPRSQKKSGIMSQELLLAPPPIAVRIKSANEFVLKDYKILNLCAMVVVLFFSLFIQMVSLDPKSRTRFRLSSLLLVGALAQSCLLEVFLPFELTTSFDRWVAMLAYCGYLAFAAQYLSSGSKAKAARVGLLCALLFLLLFTRDRVTAWIYYSFFASSALLVLALMERSLSIFILSVFTFLTSLDFIGVVGGPNSYIVPTYLAIVTVTENQRAFVSFLKINRLLKLSGKKRLLANSGAVSDIRAHALVKLFQRQFGVGLATILNITDPEVIRVQKYASKQTLPETFVLSELPPVFAHVVTTGNALIHVHAESELVISIRRGETKTTANSPYFTILPLFSGRETIGAIALTEYDPEQFRSSLNYSTFLFCLDILKGMLVEHLLTTPKTETLDKITRLNKCLKEVDLSQFKDAEDLIRESGGVLNLVFGWRVIAATLPTADNLLKVLKCFSFDSLVEGQVLSGKIYAHEDNRQGPLALAVHNKQPVIVPNTKWLDGVVHPNTTKFFTIHSTRTAAFIPVLGEDGFNVIGVYWIEGVKGSEISYSDRELFNSFMKMINERLKLIKSHSLLHVSQQSLAQFLPEHLVEAYLSGSVVSEVDHGFLMMFDLKGSTRLAHALGNSTFHEEVSTFKVDVVKVLSGSSWVLQRYVWDSFEFTLTAPEGKNSSINTSKWQKRIEPSFLIWKSEMEKKYGPLPEIRELSYRICFTYGDTSRGIVEEGITRKWTFTGNAMAVVSKVEQVSKKLPGIIFCDATVVQRSSEAWRELHASSQGIAVYGLIEEVTTEESTAA